MYSSNLIFAKQFNNKTGKTIDPRIFSHVSNFISSYLCQATDNHCHCLSTCHWQMYFMIDREGKNAHISPMYMHASMHTCEGTAITLCYPDLSYKTFKFITRKNKFIELCFLCTSVKLNLWFVPFATIVGFVHCMWKWFTWLFFFNKTHSTLIYFFAYSHFPFSFILFITCFLFIFFVSFTKSKYNIMVNWGKPTIANSF